MSFSKISALICPVLYTIVDFDERINDMKRGLVSDQVTISETIRNARNRSLWSQSNLLVDFYFEQIRGVSDHNSSTQQGLPEVTGTGEALIDNRGFDR